MLEKYITQLELCALAQKRTLCGFSILIDYQSAHKFWSGSNEIIRNEKEAGLREKHEYVDAAVINLNVTP